MTRLVLREIGRWVRAIGAPLTVLAAAVVGPSLVPGAARMLLRLIPEQAVSNAWISTLAAALMWLIAEGVRAALQPSKDACHAEHLQQLRERSALPQHSLVCVLEVLWTSTAGQRIVAVDARTGEVRDTWLAECALQPGTFALLAGAVARRRVVDHVDPNAVAAGRRYEQVREARQRVQVARAARLTHRNERRQAHEVVRAAEEFLG